MKVLIFYGENKLSRDCKYLIQPKNIKIKSETLLYFINQLLETI